MQQDVFGLYLCCWTVLNFGNAIVNLLAMLALTQIPCTSPACVFFHSTHNRSPAVLRCQLSVNSVLQPGVCLMLHVCMRNFCLLAVAAGSCRGPTPSQCLFLTIPLILPDTHSVPDGNSSHPYRQSSPGKLPVMVFIYSNPWGTSTSIFIL